MLYQSLRDQGFITTFFDPFDEEWARVQSDIFFSMGDKAAVVQEGIGNLPGEEKEDFLAEEKELFLVALLFLSRWRRSGHIFCDFSYFAGRTLAEVILAARSIGLAFSKNMFAWERAWASSASSEFAIATPESSLPSEAKADKVEAFQAFILPTQGEWLKAFEKLSPKFFFEGAAGEAPLHPSFVAYERARPRGDTNFRLNILVYQKQFLLMEDDLRKIFFVHDWVQPHLPKAMTASPEAKIVGDLPKARANLMIRLGESLGAQASTHRKRYWEEYTQRMFKILGVESVQMALGEWIMRGRGLTILSTTQTAEAREISLGLSLEMSSGVGLGASLFQLLETKNRLSQKDLIVSVITPHSRTLLFWEEWLREMSRCQEILLDKTLLSNGEESTRADKRWTAIHPSTRVDFFRHLAHQERLFSRSKKGLSRGISARESQKTLYIIEGYESLTHEDLTKILAGMRREDELIWVSVPPGHDLGTPRLAAMGAALGEKAAFRAVTSEFLTNSVSFPDISLGSSALDRKKFLYRMEEIERNHTSKLASLQSPPAGPSTSSSSLSPTGSSMSSTGLSPLSQSSRLSQLSQLPQSLKSLKSSQLSQYPTAQLKAQSAGESTAQSKVQAYRKLYREMVAAGRNHPQGGLKILPFTNNSSLQKQLDEHILPHWHRVFKSLIMQGDAHEWTAEPVLVMSTLLALPTLLTSAQRGTLAAPALNEYMEAKILPFLEALWGEQDRFRGQPLFFHSLLSLSPRSSRSSRSRYWEPRFTSGPQPKRDFQLYAFKPVRALETLHGGLDLVRGERGILLPDEKILWEREGFLSSHSSHSSHSGGEGLEVGSLMRSALFEQDGDTGVPYPLGLQKTFSLQAFLDSAYAMPLRSRGGIYGGRHQILAAVITNDAGNDFFLDKTDVASNSRRYRSSVRRELLREFFLTETEELTLFMNEEVFVQIMMEDSVPKYPLDDRITYRDSDEST